MGIIRHFHDDRTRTACFPLPVNPLIRITPPGGMAYAQTIEEKLSLLGTKQEGDRFFMPRQGVQKTDVFELMEEDIERMFALFSA